VRTRLIELRDIRAICVEQATPSSGTDIGVSLRFGRADRDRWEEDRKRQRGRIERGVHAIAALTMSGTGVVDEPAARDDPK
jgi:hypothetical protein